MIGTRIAHIYIFTFDSISNISLYINLFEKVYLKKKFISACLFKEILAFKISSYYDSRPFYYAKLRIVAFKFTVVMVSSRCSHHSFSYKIVMARNSKTLLFIDMVSYFFNIAHITFSRKVWILCILCDKLRVPNIKFKVYYPTSTHHLLSNVLLHINK